MRVISGCAKGIRLASVPGKSTRPITDRVKEALFNIIGRDVLDKSFLDLFGGTGAVGIEALSRGADHVTFLDINYRAYKVIQGNLQSTELIDFATVMKKDAFTFLREEPKESFDYIYIAPPQYQQLWEKAMNLLDEKPKWSALDGMVIVQIHPKERKKNNDYTNFRLIQERSYGDTLLLFFQHTLDE